IRDGTATYDGVSIGLQSMHATHDQTRIIADGRCYRVPDGRWRLDLGLKPDSRLLHDAEFIGSLPPTMRSHMRQINLRGPVGVRGNTSLWLPTRDDHQFEADWNVLMQLEGNRLGDVGPVRDIRGEVRMAGHRDDLHVLIRGDMNIDSAHIFDIHTTRIRGPFTITDDRLEIGLPDDGQSITARVFDGQVDLFGQAKLSAGDFSTTMTVDRVQLPTVLLEFGESGEDLTGVVSGQMELQGNIASINLLKGAGRLRFTGANLYRLPYIVQVFNLLSIRATEEHAFTDGTVDFNLFSDTLTFSDLQIWGDLISLHGGGTLSRFRELDLTFDTQVSPTNVFSQITKPFRPSRYTIWTIDVQGPIDNPMIQRRALDGVSQTLQRWLPGASTDDSDNVAEPSNARLPGNHKAIRR
ncbi:MAG: hypothetical protein AAF664_10515, partial [Planctomycetota bacterium]